MAKLSRDQLRSLADFCSNFAVAWLAAGLIAPFVTKGDLEKMIRQSLIPVMLAATLLVTMLYLTKERRKK